jgi:hypothetical protein
MHMDVSFVLLQDHRPVETLAALEPDRDWRELVTTTSAWVLQTYLRLKAAGSPVTLTNRIPSDGIAVLSTSDHRAVLKNRWASTRALLVTARGSHARTPRFADVEIVQNPVQADGFRRLFMPHWPQPGLLPRDPNRGSRIERAAFKGFPKNLHPGLRAPAWSAFLRDHGIEWVNDAVPYEGLDTDALGLQWPDYRSIDLVIAMRPDDPRMYPGRPATKLCNAWLAGVPGIMGPELAYRALRRDPLDYIEARNLAEAQAAVLQLIGDRALYVAMAGHALQRAGDFAVERIVSRWQELLFERLPRMAAEPVVNRWLGKPMALRQLAGRLRWRSNPGG